MKTTSNDKHATWAILMAASLLVCLVLPMGDSPRVVSAQPSDERAVEELRAQRVGYLVMYDSDFGAGDFEEKAAVWGIKLLGERSGAKLYELGPR